MTDNRKENQRAQTFMPRGGGEADPRRCPGCGCVKSPTWALCKACNAKYGEDRAAWPAWLTFLVSDNDRQRHTGRQDAKRRLPWGDLEQVLGDTAPDEGKESTYADMPAKRVLYIGTPGLRTDPAGMAISKKPNRKHWRPADPWPDKARVKRWNDNLGRIMLPYSPYDNEAQNREYRRANGITPVRTPAKRQSAPDQHALLTDIIVDDRQTDALALAEVTAALEIIDAAGLTNKQREALALWLEGEPHTQTPYHDRRTVAKKNRTRSFAAVGRLLGISRAAARGRVIRALARCSLTQQAEMFTKRAPGSDYL